jgi:hypothetical protein
MNNYTINIDNWTVEGGYCDIFPITNEPNLIFKQFYKKYRATNAFSIQKKLSKFNLAPKLFSSVVQLEYSSNLGLTGQSNWGYITEKASLIDYDNVKENSYLHKIQKLVEVIWEKTGLKFWDCHEHNVGYIKRGNKKYFVCIDTGKESFSPNVNAWGFSSPGPKCPYCNKYKCYCSTIYD